MLPQGCWIEDVEDAHFTDLGVLDEVPGLVIADGTATGGPERGLGIHFTESSAVSVA